MSLNAAWRIGATATLLIVGGGYTHATLAADAVQTAPIRFNIGPQSLASALNELALQAQQKIVFTPEIVKDLQSSGVSGELTVDEALGKLLSGTALSATRSMDGIIMIIRSTKKETGATPNPQSTVLTAQAASRDESLEEVVVTGSRVISNGNDSPTPLTLMSAEELATANPGTVAEALNDMPVFSGSRGQNFNPANPGQPQGNNTGASMNLRAIGPFRTLVLYDGHRVPPASVDGLVDVNMIPQMMLKRVEVVTGGASAVYGSDAVSGVVNFITDTKFEGLKVDVQGGISKYSDMKTVEGGIAFGTNLFSGRGHLMGSYQTRHDPGIDRRSSRPLGQPAWTLQGNGSAATPYFLAANARNSNSTFGGLITNGALNGQQFTSGGYLAPFVPGSTAGVTANNIQLGGDGSYNDTSLRASLDMHQVFGRFDFDFTDNLHGYLTATGTLNENHSSFTNLTLGNNGLLFSRDNAFLLPQYRTTLTNAGQTTFRVGKSFTSMPRSNLDIIGRQYFVNAGLEGSFGDGYKWEASYSNSRTKLKNRQNANQHNGRLFAALDAVVDPSTGQVVCNVTLTNPGLYPGCVPMNVFGQGSEDPAAINYVLGTTEYNSTTTMDDVAGSITGAPFNSWVGPINMALSAEWRKLGLKWLSSDQAGVPLDCTGLRFGNCSASVTNPTPVWSAATLSNRSLVTQTVSEAAIEVDVPVLKEVLLAQDVGVNAALRYTDYDTSGSALTWKVGLDWHFNDVWTMRGTRSRDIRAPNLYDLFAPTRISVSNFSDTLTNTTPQARVVAGGNADLVPEVAYTSTLGFVFRPTEKFSLSVDGFDITITDAITNIQGNDPAIQKVCYASGGTSPTCAFQERSPAGVVTRWYQLPLNFASQRTWGIDVEANYAASLFDRPVALRGMVTYQPHIIYEPVGAPAYDMGGVAFSSGNLMASPVWRVSAMLKYSPFENFTVDVVERWRSGLKHLPDAVGMVSSPDIATAAFTNVNLTYRIKGADSQADIFFNVQNLFDKQPPPGAFYGANTSPGLYGGYVNGDDVVGRYFTLGIRYRM